MQSIDFVELTTTRANPHIDPGLSIWEWQIPVYLFLGGLVAGLLILSAWAELRPEERRWRVTRDVGPLLVLPLLSIGLLALFLDLEYKWHVFRFYTVFEPTSPMSWGSWILLATLASAVPVTALALRRTGIHLLAPLSDSGAVRSLAGFAQRHRLALARTDVLLGVALGVYTGVLLSGFAARPLWNSPVLGPLFGVSGLSTAAALLALLAREPAERHALVRIDVGLILTELGLIGLWMLGLATGGASAHQALEALTGGPYTAAFWSLVVLIGLLVPAWLETMELRGRWSTHRVAPVLVLVGGIALRFVLVAAGQAVAFGG